MAPVLRKAKLASANSTIATQTLTSLIATLDYFCHMKEMEANHKEKVGPGGAHTAFLFGVLVPALPLSFFHCS